MMNYFVSYDISSDRLRNRAAKTLLRLGCRRVQKSVFFAADYTPKELARLKDELHRLLHDHSEPTDSVLCIPVPRNHLPEVVWIGENEAYHQALQKEYSWLA